MIENKLIPNLRFKEFDNKYEVKKIGDFAKINPQTSVPDNFKYIDLGSVKNGVLLSYESLNVKEAPSRAQRLLEENDIIFQAIRPYQQNNYLFNLDGKYVASTGYLQIRVADFASFLYQYFLTNKFLIQVLRVSEGSSYPAISSSAFKKISLNIPSSSEEQQKIASFLTSVDNKISLLTKKKKLLEQYKKGVMQKIFSQEIRFKEDNGNDFPDWEKSNMLEICSVKKGVQFNKSLLSEIGDYPCINGGTKPSGYSDKYNRDPNTITISEGGNSCGFVSLIEQKFWSGGHCYTIHNIDNNMDLQYLYNYLKFVEKKIMLLRQGSSLPGLPKKDLLKLLIKKPTLLEQNKIGLFISSINKKIELVGSQIEKTKEFKKGLLQQMFV